MKRTRTIKISANFKTIIDNSGFITFAITFIVAFLIGCIFVFKNNNLEEFISSEFKTFYDIRKMGKFGTKFTNSALFILPCALLSSGHIQVIFMKFMSLKALFLTH